MADLLEEESRRYQELMEAQKNNEEFMQLTQRVEQLEKLLGDKKKGAEPFREKACGAGWYNLL